MRLGEYIARLQKITGLRDSEILSLSPRQTQIKLFEFAELELEDMVREYIKNGGKTDNLSGDLLRKYNELNGINVGEINSEIIGLDDFDRAYLNALKKNPKITLKELTGNESDGFTI
jgi:hypothetical protein